ncbi:hypothetical protein H2200_013293 [Cladophialophora chaetospira]|uniref:Uncharacterized protein n=1 Tax=Cladophialophora chaetospira TaxID=386627 RepID=A0AA38WW16_9EURO|nr:hypothetical protein H2200_013293 [Cladophialophora chaetospira]
MAEYERRSAAEPAPIVSSTLLERPPTTTTDEKRLTITSSSLIRHSPGHPMSANQALEYPPHPFAESLTLILAGIPPGFSDLALTGTLSTRTILLLDQISSWAALTSKPRRSANLSQRDLFLISTGSVESAKSAVAILFALPPIATGPTLEHCLCLVLCLSIRGARHKARPARSYVRLWTDFVACARLLAARYLTRAEEHCLIWMTFLTGYGSESRAWEGQIEGLLDLLVQRYSDRVGREWEDWEGVLRDFWWLEPLGSDWCRLWERSMVRLG